MISCKTKQLKFIDNRIGCKKRVIKKNKAGTGFFGNLSTRQFE